MSPKDMVSKIGWRVASLVGIYLGLVGFMVYQYVGQGPGTALILGDGDPNAVSMTLRSSATSVVVGQSFTVEVILDTGIQRVSAVDVHLSIPSNLQATTIIPGSFLPVNLVSGTTGSGRADIVLGSQLQTDPALPQGAQGVGTIAKLTLAATQIGSVQIQIAATTQVAAIGQPGNVLTIRNPVTVTVTAVPTTTPSTTPTSTSTPTTSNTPIPTTTVTPVMTGTPEFTTTPGPTTTPEPTKTLTPVPTSTPTRTPTPKPTPRSALPVISYGSSWKYLDNGSDQGTAWQASDFNDAAWATGKGQFGYGDKDEATVIKYGPDSRRKYVTTYFRKKVTVTSPATFKEFVMKVLKDDGAAVYINGTRVAKINMPNTFTYMTLAGTGKENSITTHTLSPSLFHAGTNTVTVEVHQAARSSSDMSFDLSLEGRY